MLQQEFEQLFGKKVTEAEYTEIEKMYNNCSLNKAEFVEEFKKVGKSPLVKQLTETAEKTTVAFQGLNEKIQKIALFIADYAEVHEDDNMRYKARELMGLKNYIEHKLVSHYALTDDDRKLIINLINKK